MSVMPNGGGDGSGSSFDRVLAAVRAAGLKHKVSGSHIQSECPSHDDGSPSLSIDYKSAAGSTFLRCHSYCSAEDVLDALELTKPMLFDDYEAAEAFKARRAREREEERATGRKAPARSNAAKRAAAPKPTLPKGRLPKKVTVVEQKPLGPETITATYDYCDANGVVVQQEVRHQQLVEVVDVETGEAREKTVKRFTQRWPGLDGSWLNKAPAGFVPVLYRLPEVLGWISEGRTIYLCEGAKDADRFYELQEASTTNPSGAGNFKPEQAASLAGAHVVAVLDHDIAGYQRGLKLAEMLTEVASLKLVLPVTNGRHEDASDHFDAGLEIEDFVDVTVEELHRLERVAAAEEEAVKAKAAAAEAIARTEMAAKADKDEDRETELRYAARWAAEAGKHLVKATEILQEAAKIGPLEDEMRERLRAAVAGCQESVTTAHKYARTAISAELASYLQPAAGMSLLEDQDVVDEEEGTAGHVIDFPAKEAPRDRPSHELQTMERVVARYELVGGPGRYPRGVYIYDGGSRDDDGPGRWVQIAPLPYVHARVKQRDGSGKPTGTFYMVSAEADSEKVMIGQDEINSNSWINILDLVADQSPKALVLAKNALLAVARKAELREATPRMGEDGKLQLPYEMPIGYLTSSKLARDVALGKWAQVAQLVAQNPKFALVMGASAVSPYIAGLGNQPHVVSMYGPAKAGKTSALTACASMWGFPGGEVDAGIRLSWNATSLSVPAYLGSLACMPAFFDEIGQAGDMKDSQWHQLISNITQGAVRMTRAPRKPGVQLGLTWRGIFFSTGNGTMGTNAVGRNAGIPRRMVELSAPFTNGKEHAQAIETLTAEAWGHIGPEIIDRYALADVKSFIARAHRVLGGDYATSHEDAMAEHLAAHLAGCMLLDEILETDGALFNAALLAAGEFLDECAPPLSDSERAIEGLREWIARDPTAWPTKAQYEIAMGPRTPEREALMPMIGLRGSFAGYRDEAKHTLHVLTSCWDQFAAEIGIEPRLALQELVSAEGNKDGLPYLYVQKSQRRNGLSNVNQVMKARVYTFVIPPTAEDSDEIQPVNPAPFTGCRSEITDPQPSVTGLVTGSTPPLTSTVTGITGITGDPSRTGARASEFLFSGDEDATTVDAQPGVEDLPDEAHPATVPAAIEQSPQRGSTSVREARFSAPAACLDGDGIHLADGSVKAWPTVRHIGDLALLTGRDHLRLGWGGGEDRLPDQGQIWLFPAALERLGLPTEQPSLPEKALTKAQRAKETAKLFARLDEHPLVAGAIAEGWQLGQGGHLDVWTRIWHRDLLPQGALLVGLPWHRIEGVALFEDQPTAGELARRLLLFAQRVGVAYRITSAATGLDLIDHHRPPRRDVDDERGASRGRVALVRGVAAELPAWRAKTNDARFNGLEQDFSWWRAWDKLAESERALPYVHGYDRNASYLVPWRSIELGVEGLVHRTGDEAVWDGKEKPGYYLVDAWEWTDWGLPDPAEAAGARVGQGRLWVTVHTLKQLKAHGITPTVHESYTWDTTARYLEGPGTALGEARTALTRIAGEDPGAAAVLSTVKALYSATVGKLAEREHYADFHLWRPDWRDHVIGATKTAILHTVTRAQEISGVSPLVVDRDAVFYASDNPDPIAAWPGDPAKIGTGLGSWKPIGSTDLATWGPQFLTPKRSGARWAYADAVKTLKEQA